MKINELFLKDIHRNIEGVITASQTSDEQVYQELDEYVVTKELQGHFQTFFDAYKRGITGNTSKVGVWIQGFFGSGKSHFLKILSYLLENKEINGKTAFDFFTAGDEVTRKIKDDLTMANMKLAVDTPTNVILFNVEAKHQTGIEEESSLVNVFLKVFNDSLGFSTNPKVASLERSLTQEGKYEEFQTAFKNSCGKEWLDERHKVDFLQDFMTEALIEIGFMSETAANNWFAKLESDYQISIEEFAKLVAEDLHSKGKNEHIVFLVDEIGQYIGGNSSLTLQLQTIVEQLGDKCQGKAWVIVTSQQAIDKVTDIAGAAALDFSKIKGRFETTLSLSSANADEVIQKRILAKNPAGQEYLKADYPNHENNINLMLHFEDSPELKTYATAENYANVYPFIPYQFNLLANILTQISKHSVQGSNLSRGERSLLAFFKETAERNADNDSTALVSLDQFYPSLEKWLNETDNAKVIKQAEENGRIISNPKDLFNVEVLKVLYMIKYVDQNIKPTLNNITNLMIRSVDEDKLALRQRVEEALKILIKENIVRQNLQSYIFQTDEEQEVTRLIESIDVSATDIENKLAVDIFDEQVGSNVFTYVNSHNVGKSFEKRYNFMFNQYVDDFSHKRNSNAELEVKIITPLYDELWNDEARLVLSSTKNQMLIKLPVDKEFMDYVRTYLKVEKYITTTNTTSAIKNFAAVKSEKTTENLELGNTIREKLREFLKQTLFFFNNTQLVVTGNDFKTRLNNALQQMARVVYHKNELVDSFKTETDIKKFLNESSMSLVQHNENQNVVDEVVRFIKLKEANHLTVTLKLLRDQFIGKEPYGFVDLDLQWAMARLFKEGKISIYKNSIQLATTDSIQEISDAIFERRTPEKIRIESKKVVGEAQKRLVKEVGEALFHSLSIVDDNNDDLTRESFIKKAQSMIEELKRYKDNGDIHYPQGDLLEEILQGLKQITNVRDTTHFFELIKEKEEDLLDWAEDLEDVRNFHTGTQKVIWNKAVEHIQKVKKSTIQASTPEIDSIVEKMRAIMKVAIPYKSIPQLSTLNAQFETTYTNFIEEKATIAQDKVLAIREDVLADLKRRDLAKSFEYGVNARFTKLIRDLEKYQTVDQIELVPVRAENLQEKFIEEFTDEENRIRKEKEKENKEEKEAKDPTIGTPPKPTKYLKNVELSKLISVPRRLKTKEDVENYVNDLKTKLLSELKENIELDVRL